MPALEPSRVSGFAALFASLGLHALVLGGIVAGAIAQPPETSGAGAWAGRTFEISNLSEVVPTAAESQAPAAPSVTPAPPAGEPEVDPERAASTAPTHESEKPHRPSDDSSGAEPRSAPRENPPTARQPSRGGTSASPNTARATAGAPSPAAESGATSPAGGGVYGAEGAAARRGNLPDAFTRALPAAARAQSVWRSLPLGPAGRAVVVVRLDDEGKVAEVTPLGAVPAHVEHLLRTTRLLLQAGRFAPAPEGAAGEYRLGLRAMLDQVDASLDESALPEQVRHLASRYPTKKVPGEATVTYNSGRRVRFEVFLDPERRTDW
jgi:hypothetical protein